MPVDLSDSVPKLGPLPISPASLSTLRRAAIRPGIHDAGAAINRSYLHDAQIARSPRAPVPSPTDMPSTMANQISLLDGSGGALLGASKDEMQPISDMGMHAVEFLRANVPEAMHCRYHLLHIPTDEVQGVVQSS